MRRVFGMTLVALASVIALPPATLRAASLRPSTVLGWRAYVHATEARITRELASEAGFLAQDFSPSPDWDRRSLMAGRVGIVRVSTPGVDGSAIAVPEGMVHHWRGSVFIPDASVDQVLARVAHPGPGDIAQDDVIGFRVLDRGPGSLRLFLRLRRTQIVTVVYNTEHAVRYTRHGAGRATSRSVATRIAEVAAPATPDEWERPLGEDRGFLWGLNSYWRYEQAPGGVLVECESISLSRAVPSLVRGAVRPLIDQVARGSMERTLLAMRDRFARKPSQGD
jgi:hypothetical protein